MTKTTRSTSRARSRTGSRSRKRSSLTPTRATLRGSSRQDGRYRCSLPGKLRTRLVLRRHAKRRLIARKSRQTAITYQPRSMRTTMALSRSGSMTGTSRETCRCPSTSTTWRQWGQISATTPSWGSKMQRRWRRRTRPSTSSTSDRQTEWRCGSFAILFLSIRQRRRPHVPNCTHPAKQ
jgi:hypothetical protein